jgi:hypothetical protein
VTSVDHHLHVPSGAFSAGITDPAVRIKGAPTHQRIFRRKQWIGRCQPLQYFDGRAGNTFAWAPNLLILNIKGFPCPN